MAEVEWYGYILPVAGGVIGGGVGHRIVRRPELAGFLGFVGGTLLGIWVYGKIKARVSSSPATPAKLSSQLSGKLIAGE